MFGARRRIKMAISLQEFLKQTPSLRNFYRCGRILVGGADPSPSRVIDSEEVCGDCQTNQISEMIDQHPIGRPMAR